MPFNCKGICGPIAHKQQQLKLQFFANRKWKGTRPRELSIAAISRKCIACGIRFYFIDDKFCPCCGCRLRGRTALNNMLEINEQKMLLVSGAPTSQ